MKKRIGAGLAALLLALTTTGVFSTAASAARILVVVGTATCQYDATTPREGTRAVNSSCYRVAARTRSFDPNTGVTAYRSQVIGVTAVFSPLPPGHFYAGGLTQGAIRIGNATYWVPRNV